MLAHYIYNMLFTFKRVGSVLSPQHDMEEDKRQ